MAKYNFGLTFKVFNGHDQACDDSLKRFGIDEDAMKRLFDHTEHLRAEWQQVKDKGGPLTVQMSRTVEAVDGGTLPPEANGSLFFQGLTWDGIAHVEVHMLEAGKDLLKMAQDHAKKKRKEGAATPAPIAPGTGFDGKPIPPGSS